MDHAEFILIVSNNSAEKAQYKELLAKQCPDKFEFLDANSISSVINIVQSYKVTACFLDFTIVGIDGIKFIKELNIKIHLNFPIIILTEQGDELLGTDAFRIGVTDYLIKSTITGESLEHTLNNALDKYALSRKILEQNQLLIEQNKETHQLYHILAHELKSPLTTLQGATSLILNEVVGSINQKQRELLTSAVASCQLMTMYINDLTELSMVDSSKLNLNITDNKIQSIVTNAVNTVQQALVDKQITVEKDNCDFSAQCDKQRVEQILINLLNNAIKFSPEQSNIQISFEQNQAKQQVIIAIKDQGPGIPPNEVDRIFDRFYQSNNSVTKVNGLGIGLNLCQLLVNKQHGSIWVESDGKNGSCFFVALPASSN